MDTYKCEVCGETFDIERFEAMFGNHEHYEHQQCEKCFEEGVR